MTRTANGQEVDRQIDGRIDNAQVTIRGQPAVRVFGGYHLDRALVFCGTTIERC